MPKIEYTNKVIDIWEKAPECYCGNDDCSLKNHRKCGICGEIMLYGSHQSNKQQNNSWYAWNIDHIKPISRGGTNNNANLHAVHIRCNWDKGNG